MDRPDRTVSADATPNPRPQGADDHAGLHHNAERRAVAPIPLDEWSPMLSRHHVLATAAAATVELLDDPALLLQGHLMYSTSGRKP
jgi:hypothetical protein